MRVALKIAYDGRGFHGHQRQPHARTVEGECIAAAMGAKLFRDPQQAFFRSASRTDRGVSAIGNVIAFNANLRGAGIVGAFNDRARDVWAWAFAPVPDDFHPRKALERWYRYHLFEDLPLRRLREASALFEGEHDFGSFTSDRPVVPMVVDRVDVSSTSHMIVVDIRAPRFRRGMVRRIVSSIVAHGRGELSLEEIANALNGERRDFGMVPPEPLTLMDVRYPFAFDRVPGGKALHEWAAIASDLRLRLAFHRELQRADRYARRSRADARQRTVSIDRAA